MATAYVLTVLSAGSIVSMFSVDVNVECVCMCVCVCVGGGGEWGHGWLGVRLVYMWWNFASVLVADMGKEQKHRYSGTVSPNISGGGGLTFLRHTKYPISTRYPRRPRHARASASPQTRLDLGAAKRSQFWQ